MLPWEREIYVGLLMNYLKEEEEKKRKKAQVTAQGAKKHECVALLQQAAQRR